MTPKDLRDIAAYWGATCSYELLWGDEWRAFTEPVAQFLWEVYGKETPFVYGQDVRGFRLHLRESVLTEEERNQALTYVNLPPEFVKDWHIGLRYKGVPLTAATATLVSYLQSIGVYVPGTIDPQFVQLS
ncbi:hypothetical protein [Spirosoma sp. 209]|uniref:hypothetical protein n=1 Tax=Spirosoma sp. 209 TaxID=1955701 RepID=UPI00098D15B3|nr:hypothetical protein [Spirosoma sp. 209]